MHKQYIIISLILLTPVLLAIWLLDRSQPQLLIALLLAIPFFYRGYMEWKYVKETKRHRVSFMLAFTLLFEVIVVNNKSYPRSQL
ncbi:DUF4181 domain-containing protein [Paenibacillus sp. HGF5]|uniref:DUF4181 domain-containing protein n=1 Tax=Paenibacillus sp. HGF5 TaxID=908341 RepID=UPI003F8A90E2